MKKNIFKSLQSSLEHERTALKDKKLIIDRFEMADDVFNNFSKPKNADLLEEKITVIRDTFTLPQNDYNLIDICKSKLLENKISATKSEIVRSGLILLSKLSDKELMDVYNSVEKIKIGRPKNN